MSSTTLQEQARKLLIIEDEGDMCLLLNILLDGKNLQLDHVKGLTAAADYLAKETPAVVLLDNKLPDGFGIDFIPYIKTRYPTVGIIMISGFDASAQDVALYNGADCFLEKPFTKDQLFNAVNSLLQREPELSHK